MDQDVGTFEIPPSSRDAQDPLHDPWSRSKWYIKSAPLQDKPFDWERMKVWGSSGLAQPWSQIPVETQEAEKDQDGDEVWPDQGEGDYDGIWKIILDCHAAGAVLVPSFSVRSSSSIGSTVT